MVSEEEGERGRSRIWAGLESWRGVGARCGGDRNWVVRGTYY